MAGRIPVAMRGPLVRTQLSTAFFTLLQHRESFSSSTSYIVFFFFFFQRQEKKGLYSHNKNKSVLYLTIYFKYFHYEA